MLAHKFYAIHALLGIYIPAWLRVNIVQLGVCNKTVEIDETQIGHRKHGRGRDKRVAIVFDMIERGTELVGLSQFLSSMYRLRR